MKQSGNRWIRRMEGWIACFLLLMFGTVMAVYADTKGTIRASLNASQTTCTVSWSDYRMPSDGEKLIAAVWSEKDGQDDLKWRDLTRSGDSYSVKFSVSAHGTAGQYQVHLYLRTKAGKMVMLDHTVFTVSEASCSAVSTDRMDQKAGTCRVVITGLASPSGIEKVQVPVWSKSDQSDIVWYDAVHQKDGTWTAEIRFSRHKNNKGQYQIHVYARSTNQVFNFVGRTKTEYTGRTTEQTELSARVKGSSVELKTTGISHADGIRSVSFAVWSAADGQDDLRWSTASYSSGTAEKTIDLKEYCDFGTYHFHVYATTNKGKQFFVGKTTFEVPFPSAADTDIAVNGDKFTITVSGISCVSGIDRVVIPVWSQADQSDIVWYKAEKQKDGSYRVASEFSRHKNHTDYFYIHVFIYDDRDSYGYNAVQTNMSVRQQPAKRSAGDLTVAKTAGKAEYQLSVADVVIPEAYASVQMAVWTDKDS